MSSSVYEQYMRYITAKTDSEKRVVVLVLETYADELCFGTSDSDLGEAASARELLGRCFFELGDSERAENNFKRSLEIYERLSSPMRAAQVAVQLAMLYLTVDRQVAAEDMLSLYAKRQMEEFGEDHFQSINAIEMKAAVHDKKDLPESQADLVHEVATAALS